MKAVAHLAVLLATAAILGGVLLWLTLPAPRPLSDPVFTGSPPSRIVFVSIGVERKAHSTELPTWDLWAMNPDGSGRVPLTRDAIPEVDPVWSPDGREVAFAALSKPGQRHSDIWRMNADGSGRRRLTQQPEGMMVISPVWSPGGRYLAFGRDSWDDGPWDATELWVIDRNGRGAKVIGDGIPVGWATNGEILAIRPERGLWIFPARGGRPTPRFVAADDGGWTRDGQRLVGTVTREGQLSDIDPLTLWLDESGARSPRRIGRFEDRVYSPRWTADGEHLVYTCILKEFWGYSEDTAIFITDRDGKRPRRISPPGAQDWSGGGYTGHYLFRQLAPAFSKRDLREGELFDALQHNEIERAKQLLAGGVDPDTRGIFDIPGVVEAASIGNLELVRLFIERGADVNARTPLYACSHHSALYVAAHRGGLELTRLLLDAGAKPDPPTYEAAGRSGDPAVLELLRERFGKLHPATVVGAADARDLTLLRRLLGEEMDPNARGAHGDPAIVWAAKYGGNEEEAIRLLLDHGADVNATSPSGRTALMEAAQSHYKLPTVRLLISRGADVNLADRRGFTALMDATDTGNSRLVRFLLAHGARPEWKPAWTTTR